MISWLSLGVDRPCHASHQCRLCGTPLTRTFVDLGMSPLCESYIPADRLDEPEVFYPLHVRLCDACLLVQLPAYVPGEQIFSDYAYFSSYSDSWVAHAKRYAEAMIDRLALTPGSLVTEVASNDGYLLQHFQAAGIPVLGVEPAANVAEAAQARGIPTEVQFLGPDTGRRDRATAAAGPTWWPRNNVFAHVPDIRGFAAGLRALVKDTGLVTLEFPHLLRLIERRQYDTIYHEHFSYLSLLTSSRGPGHGRAAGGRRGRAGHPRRFAAGPRPARGGAGEPTASVKAVLDEEEAAGLHTVAGHEGFAAAVLKIKSDLLGFLLAAAQRGPLGGRLRRPGQGQHPAQPLRHPVRPALLHRRPQPGQAGEVPARARTFPIYAPERLAETRPDYVLVLPWNLREEISRQLDYVRSWGGKLVFPIPELDIV